MKGLILLLILPASDAIAAQEVIVYRGWVDSFILWLMTPGLGAVIIGVVCAFFIPQRVKMDFPLAWDRDKRSFMTRLTSFLCGFFGTLLFWPLFWPWGEMTGMQAYGVVMSGMVTAVLVGSAAPFTYSVVMGRLYRAGWLDEKKWSGEAHAEAKIASGATDGVPEGGT